MLQENDCPREDRFLPLLSVVGKSNLPTIEIIKDWTKNDDLSEEILSYLKWEKLENQIITFNGFGYCDLNIPKSYNFLIDTQDNRGGQEINATVKISLWNGIIPLDRIEYGHKAISVIEFDDSFPRVLYELKDFRKTDFKVRFGLCDKSDKDFILRKRKKT